MKDNKLGWRKSTNHKKEALEALRQGQYTIGIDPAISRDYSAIIFLDLSVGYVDTRPRKHVESRETDWNKPKLITEVNVNENFNR